MGLRQALDEAAEYFDEETNVPIVAALLINEGLVAVASAISGLHEAVRSDHPLQACTLDGISESLGEIASAVGEIAAKLDMSDLGDIAGAIGDIGKK